MGRVKDACIGQLETRGAWDQSAFDLRHRVWNVCMDINQDVRAADGWQWADSTRRAGVDFLREQAALLLATADNIEQGRDAGPMLVEYAERTRDAA